MRGIEPWKGDDDRLSVDRERCMDIGNHESWYKVKKARRRTNSKTVVLLLITTSEKVKRSARFNPE
ncbi:hypothetical protein Syun_009168 [Stephania yunnanensis]|uniref:Uncharacterized protein n=1 Tax=Stephania yunnanensis TaxID=152371 RepID=A0AAP0KFV5_9MAGN